MIDDPFKTKLKLYLGQEDGLANTVVHNYRIFRDYGNNDHVEKFVVFAFDCVELNPSVKFYDILMRDYLKSKFNIEPEDLHSKWATRCWSCSSEAANVSDLKTCSKCKRAKYCSRECQSGDWGRHKLLHKELDLTRRVLAERETEGEVEGSKMNVHVI